MLQVPLYNAARLRGTSHFSLQVVYVATALLRDPGIVGGVFDKFLTKQYGICHAKFCVKVCGPLWSTWGAPLGDGEFRVKVGIVDTKVAHPANLPPPPPKDTGILLPKKFPRC